MNWKNLGNATLITTVLFGIVALFLWLGYYCPLALVVIGFVGLVAIIYRAMEKDSYDSDSDRMSWFSHYDDDEQED